MVEIKDRDNLERWLKDRPREDAVAIAARAALRVVPLVVTALEKDAEQRRATIVLPIFRALATSWAITLGPIQGAKIRQAARASATAFAAFAAIDRATAVGVEAAAAAAYAARAATAYSDDASALAARAVAYSIDAAEHFTETAGDVIYEADAYGASYAGSTAWKAVSGDVTTLQEEDRREQIFATPLWIERVPSWVGIPKEELRRHLRNADEGWEVWTGWYDDRLHGRPFNKALEEARVLIPSAIWDQGPKAVNAEIKRLIEEHTITGSMDVTEAPDIMTATGAVAQTVSVGTAFETNSAFPIEAIKEWRGKLDAALTSVELSAALTDFKHDPATNRIDLIPFAEDLPQLPTDALRADHASKLAALTAGCSGLATDLKEDAPNVPKALGRDLRRYAKEAGNGPGLANPRLLSIYGAALTRAHGDAETMLGLGNYLGGKLGDIVAAHSNLIADHPPSVAMRIDAAADIPLGSEATPDAVAETLDLIADNLPKGDWGNMPTPPADLSDLLHDQAEGLREIDRQIDLVGDAMDRAMLERRRHQISVSALSTIARYAVFTALVVLTVTAPFPTATSALAGMGIARFIDHLYPDKLRPHLRRVINWLFVREPDQT